MSELKASNTTENLRGATPMGPGIPAHEQTILAEKRERFQEMLRESSSEILGPPHEGREAYFGYVALSDIPVRKPDDSGSVAHESIAAVEAMAELESEGTAYTDLTADQMTRGLVPSPAYRIHQLEDRVTALEARIAAYNVGAPHKL